MKLTVETAAQYDLAELATIMNRAFKDYVGGTANLTAETFAGFIGREGTDLSLSQVVLHEGKPVGFGFIAHQGWTSRLAGMGIVPEMTERGVGTWFMKQLISQARDRGDHRLVLEVIEQNPRGVRLYTGTGFKIVQRLYGYTAQPGDATPTPGWQAVMDEVDVFDVAKVLTTYGPPDLPWQVSGSTIARLGPGYQAYRLGPAMAVISDPERELIALSTVVVPSMFKRQGHGSELVRTLMARHPGKTWKIPAICPESIGEGFFTKLGFERDELSQFQMELDLTQL